jgi:hypothetical protein
MQQEKGSKVRLFLAELIIVLFFFLLVSTVCVQIFAKSFALSRSSKELSHAQSLCASFWEAINGTDPLFSSLSSLFPDGMEENGDFYLYYDQEFVPCKKEQAIYSLCADIQVSDHEKNGMISFSKGTCVLYSLEVFSPIPTKRKEALS